MSHCSWDKWNSTESMGEGCLIRRIRQMRPGINHKEESGENMKIKGGGEKINSCAMRKWLIRVIWGGKGSRRKYFPAQEEWREYLQRIPRSEPLLAKTQKHCFLRNRSTKSFSPKGGLVALPNALKSNMHNSIKQDRTYTGDHFKGEALNTSQQQWKYHSISCA